MPVESRAKVASDRAKWKKHKESHMKRVATLARKRTTITWYQKMAMQILESNEITYIAEQPIPNYWSFYLIDIYIPQYKICIEIDGSSHDLPEIAEADRIRDNFLKKSWYWVMRIKNEEVRYTFLRRIKNVIKLREYYLTKQ